MEHSHMTRRKEQEAIDTILDTLYALDAQGYQVLDAKVAKSEAVHRIQRTLSRLDKEKRKTVEDEANYRLERFQKFTTLSDTKRDEILRIAREQHVSIEEAYKIASQS